MDLDSDSPSSCVTSSSSASEDDDLCSTDEADLTDNLELNTDDNESDSGRVSHVSCSVDESDDEDKDDPVSFLLMIRLEYMLM